ncbi:ROK family transcriptional regulator [Actinoallomurus acaciae]|uniref:ROK family transcriptional regulator n=1 Tax=Actinoallomurus acaciae TaxID=502577 RepID=A0ABV5YLR2_9ACTN
MATVRATGTGDTRWVLPALVVGEFRRHPAITRSRLAATLGLSSSSATDLMGRLEAARLVAEVPLPAGTRGRPKHRLVPHPEGPVVAVVDVQRGTWRLAVGTLDGRLHETSDHRYGSASAPAVLDDVRGRLHALRERYGTRLRGIGVSVAGVVRDGRVADSSMLRWNGIDLQALGVDGVPVIVDNDATLAAIADTVREGAPGSRTTVHVTIEAGLGGGLIDRGAPVVGATGAGAEFGHLPFGDPAVRCPCGAYGCWGTELDGHALARALGEPEPDDPRRYMEQVIGRAAGDRAAQEAVERAARALARGIAGLANALDPDLVTLGGLAVPLHAASVTFDDAYRRGLMGFRRQSPPEIVPAECHRDAALRGAAHRLWDQIATPGGLSAWARTVAATP